MAETGAIRAVQAKRQVSGSGELRATLAAAAVFLAVAGLLFYRSSRGGLELRDFRDAVYYPVVSLLEGHNPYDTARHMATYPVEQIFPPYPPLILALHLPFGFLPFELAQVAYFATTVVLLAALSYVTLLACALPATGKRVFGLATLLILSRPGYWNLALGQVSVPVVIGTYLALRYGAEREWLSGLGLALALLKPTYGLPLAVLLLVRRHARPVIYGGGIAALLAAIPTAALLHSAGGPGPFVASLQQSYARFQANPDAGVNRFPGRVDAVALIVRLFGHGAHLAGEGAISLTILALGVLAVRRLAGERDAGARALSNSVVCLTILTFAYHQAYDLLLLALPLVALASDRWAPAGVTTPRLRWILLALLGLPAANYLAARPTLNFIDAGSPWVTVLMSMNASALIVALCICLAVALRSRPAHNARLTPLPR
ncbi:MAG: glycosyltransferase family 87 protein [Candidatus Binatia bacterium]